MNTKTFNLQVKQLQGERVFRAIASDESIIDRDNEIIKASAWSINGGLNNFKANPVILYGHDGRNNLPISKATNIWIESGKLMIDVQFPPEGTSQLSDECYGLVKAGILKTLSVGFIGKNYEFDKAGRKVWTDCELLEVSLTPTPSNVGARVVEVKSSKQDIEFDLSSIHWPGHGDTANLVIGSKGIHYQKSVDEIDLDTITWPKSKNVEDMSATELKSAINRIVSNELKNYGLKG